MRAKERRIKRSEQLQAEVALKKQKLTAGGDRVADITFSKPSVSKIDSEAEEIEHGVSVTTECLHEQFQSNIELSSKDAATQTEEFEYMYSKLQTKNTSNPTIKFVFTLGCLLTKS